MNRPQGCELTNPRQRAFAWAGWLNDAIESDVQALMWNKEMAFDPDELGSESNHRRFLKKDAQHNKKPFGINLLPWIPHLKALQVRWILRYRDATEGDWKKALDLWLAAGSEGRGSPFTTLPIEFLLNKRPNRTRTPAIPSFWIEAIRALRELNLTQLHKGLFHSKEDARSQPLFNNPLFKLRNTAFQDTWQRELNTNTVADLFSWEQNRYFNPSDIQLYITNKLRTYKGKLVTSQHKPIPIKRLLTQFDRFFRDIPGNVLFQMKHGPTPADDERYSRQARTIMSIMDWDPTEGLGPEGEGITEPVQPARGGFKPSSNSRKKNEPITFVRECGGPKDSNSQNPNPNSTKPKPKQDSLKAFLLEGKWLLGWLDEVDNKPVLTEADRTMRGYPIRSNRKHTLESFHLPSMPALKWGKGVLGPAEFIYPHPKGWCFNHNSIPLDALTVKTLTTLFTSLTKVDPSFIDAWEKRLGKINWLVVATKYYSKVLTPRDWATHFKLILHRAFFTRVLNRDAPNPRCRCCHKVPETILHLGICTGIAKVWKYYDPLTHTPPRHRTPIYRLFGLVDGSSLPHGLMDLHTLVWKYILLALVAHDLDNEPFLPATIWKRALARYIRAVEATAYVARTAVETALHRGLTHKDASIEHLKKHLYPTAFLNEHGRLFWRKDMITAMKAADIRYNPKPMKDFHFEHNHQPP